MTFDDAGTRAVPGAPRLRPLVLLAAGALAAVVLLHVNTAGADNCGNQRQQCADQSMSFCGGDRIAGCLFTCCPDNGCCLFYDDIGVNGAQCCPSSPDADATCSPGCTYTCKRPCGPTKCCSTSLNEQCIPSPVPNTDGTCCPAGQVCGVAFQSCCTPPDVCTPAGVCCPSATDEACGSDECCHGLCCNNQCCPAGSTCYGDPTAAGSFCCAPHQDPCTDRCCDVNETCKHKRHGGICKCKKKGKKCGRHRCCKGDACIDGECTPPLPF
jgi:hypothetical protein